MQRPLGLPRLLWASTVWVAVQLWLSPRCSSKDLPAGQLLLTHTCTAWYTVIAKHTISCHHCTACMQHTTYLIAAQINTSAQLTGATLGWWQPHIPTPCHLTCTSPRAAAATRRDGGTLVTYGGMSMQPVTIPTSLLIFKDLTFRGFWLSGRWSRAQGPQGRAAVINKLVDYARKGHLNTRWVGPRAKPTPMCMYMHGASCMCVVCSV